MMKILVHASLLVGVNGVVNASGQDVIQEIQKEWREDLGHARMRDPNVLPPHGSATFSPMVLCNTVS